MRSTEVKSMSLKGSNPQIKIHTSKIQVTRVNIFLVQQKTTFIIETLLLARVRFKRLRHFNCLDEVFCGALHFAGARVDFFIFFHQIFPGASGQ